MPGGSYEQLSGPTFRAMPRFIAKTSAGQFAGRATIGSGQALAVVPTTAVRTDTVILLSTAGGSNVTSSSPIDVRTVVPGVSFTVGFRDGTAAIPAGPLDVMFVLFRVG